MRIESPLMIKKIFADGTFSDVSMTPKWIINDLTRRYSLLQTPERMAWFTTGLMNGLIPHLYATSSITSVPGDPFMESTVILNKNQVKGLVSQAAIYLRNSRHDRAKGYILKEFESLLKRSPLSKGKLTFHRSVGRYVRERDYVDLRVDGSLFLGSFKDFLTIGFSTSPFLTTNVFMGIFKSWLANV